MHSAPDFALLPCRDGKTRRTESGIFPLVNGIPRGVVPSGKPSDPSYCNATAEARAIRLKGYGNAIVPPLAAAFITAFTQVSQEHLA
jgi:DNA (cytosine-5)-methyltransferase 1